ncbi:hypothetical protein [Lacunimicrobium album]
MRHQGLLAFLAVLICTASVFFYVFETKIGGDYELVKKEGFFKAWQIKSAESAEVEEPAEPFAQPSEQSSTNAQTSTDNVPLTSTPEIATFEQRTLKTPVDGVANESSTDDTQSNSVSAHSLKVPLIRVIPKENWEVKREFNQAASRSCRLMPAGTLVSEGFSPRNVQKTVFEGRPTAFTVGLRVDPLFRSQLPSISKGTIEGYLDDHLLAIQPVVTKNASGYAFTGEVRSAFFDRSNPTRTIEPEAMIATAVQEFRVLGVYDDSKDGNTTSARTLVMAFRFLKQENELNLVIGKPVEAFELLMIHLPKASVSDEVEIVTFATAGNRQDLQLLAAVDKERAADLPSIQANIRFEEFRAMLYPAKPVVTGIQNRIQSSTPMADLQKKLDPTAGVETVMLSAFLDQFVN